MALASFLGLPAAPYWADYVLGVVERKKRIEVIDGIGCEPVVGFSDHGRDAGMDRRRAPVIGHRVSSGQRAHELAPTVIYRLTEDRAPIPLILGICRLLLSVARTTIIVLLEEINYDRKTWSAQWKTPSRI